MNTFRQIFYCIVSSKNDNVNIEQQLVLKFIFKVCLFATLHCSSIITTFDFRTSHKDHENYSSSYPYEVLKGKM